jgi:GTPase SAR1 family protein
MMDTFEYDVLLKFLLVGDTQVGKSSLLLQYSDGVFSQNTISTIGLDLKLKTQNVEGKDVRVQIIYFIISSNNPSNLILCPKGILISFNDS